MNIPKKPERGQSLLIFAVALIGMLGFTALAVDGGMAFNERRLAQSAADASSLAGARAAADYAESLGFVYNTGFRNCDEPAIMADARDVAENAAMDRADSNAFNEVDLVQTDNTYVEATFGCELNAIGNSSDKYIDVKTVITRKITTAFVQLFLPEGITSTVESIVRVRPRIPYGWGNAIVALREDCDGTGENKGGVTFEGSNNTRANGGGVWSNACMRINGDPDVTAPSFTYRSTPAPIPEPANTTFDPDSEPIGLLDMDPPDCYGPNMDDESTNGYKKPGEKDILYFDPGRYSGTLAFHGKYDPNDDTGKRPKIHLNPGLYCLDNGVNFNGGFIEGEGVTFYLIGGAFSTSGNAEIHLTAPTGYTNDFPPSTPISENNSIPGMLIYLPEGQTDPVKLTGGAGSYYVGAVYAPSATCEVAGTTDGIHDFNSTVICGTVKVSGDANITVNYDHNSTLVVKPKLDQLK